jgi:hypothetical protein
MNEPRSALADYLKQKRRESRQWIAASGENPHIGPRIEVMLNWQQEELFVCAPVAKLGAIGVLFPTDAVHEFPIGGMESDEVTAAAMVWAEDKLLRRQLREGALDVGCAKPRTIPTDRDNFVIAKPRDSFDRVLKPRREIPARLPVNVRSDGDRFSGRREKMKINLRRNLKAQACATKKRPRRTGERTPPQVDVDFVGKYKNSSSGHAFGYETARPADKPFSPDARKMHRRRSGPLPDFCALTRTR